MKYELNSNEKRLLAALKKEDDEDGKNKPQGIEPAVLGTKLNTSPESIIQYANLLASKELCTVSRVVTHSYKRTEEGEQYVKDGLPERQLYNSFDTSIPMGDLNKHPLAKIGIGWMRRLKWITIRDGIVIKAEAPPSDLEHALLQIECVDPNSPTCKELMKRELISETETASYYISITEKGKELAQQGFDLREELGTLTSEQIISGSWKDQPLRRYDVTKPPKRIYPGKIHPYQQLIDEMRHILLSMGFTELHGSVIQSAFWNFDALFQPQDHPAREMQDTFHLPGSRKLPNGWEEVRDIHEHGGTTSSTGWGGYWDPDVSKKLVLRTHTTCLSVQTIAKNQNPPQKAFCIGRVYRREAIDPTHTPEFEQLEGIVMDEGLTFSHLMGYLREFYNRMGFEAVRFRPAYFPYTEPSVEPEIYVEELGWVELGGAGIFREEVTAPWGVSCPVLAWGLGVSRVAMLRMGLRDLSELYQSNIDWIKSYPIISTGER
jgi:phenylalanyl-tRNA synthetase alpha chain